MPVSQKIEYQMQRISVNLTNVCDENQRVGFKLSNNQM